MCTSCLKSHSFRKSNRIKKSRNLSQNFNQMISAIGEIPRYAREGFVTSTSAGVVRVRGLSSAARVGDLVTLHKNSGLTVYGEVLSVQKGALDLLPESGVDGVAVNDRVSHHGALRIMPHVSWLGRVIDPFMRPLDGMPLITGSAEVPLKSPPPTPTQRKRFGGRLPTKIAAFDTLLPLVRGQRLGVFSGSGVGKSTLIADLAKGVQADVVIITLIGERGREVRDFIEDTLGKEGLQRAVIIAATSDKSAMIRRKAAWVGMAVAEYFRDEGAHVLLLADSVTRFAEAHREIALTTGETASLGGFPPSITQELMSLSERAGPGPIGKGDITAIFSVLLQGTDMDGPVADVMRGVLDGHVVLSRNIAERGRFPAIDVSKSVSRSLPGAASTDELELLSQARIAITTYEESQTLIQSGLYDLGSDATIDHAISVRPKIEAFLSNRTSPSIQSSYSQLEDCLNGH